MEMKSVASSNIASYGYDQSSETLRIRFHNAAIYDYAGVPLEVVQAMIEAPSIGSYFSANIRNAYPTTKLS